MKKDKFQKALGYAERLLGIRPRSEKELKERLFRKRFDRQIVQDIVALFKEKKIIDDSQFAKLWVESRMRTNPKGDMLLRRELREKGVPAAAIEKALTEKKESGESVIKALAAKKFGTLKNLPKEKARKKLFEFLARRGFEFDAIDETIRELMN